MRPPPTTAEYLVSWALRAPAHPALREEGTEVTYSQLCGMVIQAVHLLRRHGVKRGDRVAVAGPGFGIQLVVLLAAEGLGASTLSFQAEGDPDIDFVLSHAEWVIARVPQVVPAPARFIALDDAFLRELRQPVSELDGLWAPLEAHEIQRISRTSGSTGRSKFMPLSRRAQEYWVSGSLDVKRYTPDTRLLICGPLVMNVAFTRSSTCLRSGGLVMAGSGAWLPQLAPTDLWGLPVQIERLLHEAPPDWRSAQPVPVSTVGGVLSPALRQRLREVFHAEPVSRYGNNETGVICDDLDAGGTGVMRHGVEVRILDAEGRDQPRGVWGRIAVRTPSMAEGYIDLPAETAQSFQNGWFISADVGALVASRRLRLAGRQDDLVNIAGIKMPATQIEDALRAGGEVRDCAVVAVNLQGGEVTVGVALVLAPGATAAQAQARLKGLLRLDAETLARMLVLPELPLMHTGKVDRMALQRMFQSQG